MAKKRPAASELNRDNWDVDDEPEEEGTFKVVSPEVMSKRVIRIARRKLPRPNAEQSKIFSSFSGFTKPNPSTPDIKNTFSFLTNSNGGSASSQTSVTPKSNSTDLIGTMFAPVENAPNSTEITNSKIKVLNECLIKWINKWVSQNPTCVLTPVFQDYETHLRSIKAEIETLTDSSKPTVMNPDSKLNFTGPVANSKITTSGIFSSHKEIATLPSVKQSNISLFQKDSNWLKSDKDSIAGSYPNNKPVMAFNLNSYSPTFLQNPFGSGNNESKNGKEDEGDDEPPASDFKPVTEDDALYSQRVKVFVKGKNKDDKQEDKKETFLDRGIGNLFIKEAKNSNGDQIYQAIVRADTTSGNIIFNIRISKDIPIKRVGKNNVMLMCLPTPDSEPPPVAVLLRVKTEEDADKLLTEINKYK